jgi:hypothetical protein
MIGLIGRPETSVANYQPTLPNNPEERWPQQDVWRLPDICPVTGNLSVILPTVGWVKPQNVSSFADGILFYFWEHDKGGSR